MSITPPTGILDITNATVRVSKLEFRESTGFDTILNNVARNTVLLVDQNVEYTSSNSWALKLPNAWVAEFEAYWASGASGNIDFNVYNNLTSGTNGYTISMDDTTITVAYDGGSALETATLGSTLKNDTWRKIHVLFERDMISVALDGVPVLYFKDTLLRPRVYDENSGYVVVSGLSADRKFKNIRVVNGDKWITDGTSNIAYVHGNVGIGTKTPEYTLDVKGDVRATGNLLIEGLTTTVDTQNLSIEDAIVEIGRGNDGGTSGKDVGFLFTRNNGSDTTNSNVALIYDESTDRLTLGYSDGGPTDSTLAINTSKSLDVVIPSGNLGVGTASPARLLELAADGGGAIINLKRTNAGTGQGALAFVNVNSNVCASITASRTGAEGGNLLFYTTEDDPTVTSDNPYLISQRMCIASGGNVGIGTDTPQEKLHLYGSPMIQHETIYTVDNTEGWYKIGTWDAGATTGARLKISLLGAEGYSTGTPARGGETILYASINNNLGTTVSNMSGTIHAYGEPVITQAKFQQVGTDRTKYDIIVYVESYTQHSMSIECTQSTSFTRAWTSASDPGADSATVQAALFTHVVDNSGNVGIGTANPTSLLHIVNPSTTSRDVTVKILGGGPQATNDASRATLELHGDYNNSSGWGGYIEGFHESGVNHGLGLGTFTSGSKDGYKMWISPSGRIGINTTNPLGGLDVNKSQSGTVNVNNNQGGYVYTWNGSIKFYNDPTAGVAVNADAGNMVAHGFYAGYSVNFQSDRRIKKDIQEIQDDEALIKFRQLKPSKYKYKEPLLSDRTDKEVYGFIAQEVAEVLPEAVEIGNSKETNQAHIPNIMSLCRVDVESIDASAYENLSAELQGEYTQKNDAFVRYILTITDTLDTDTFANVSYQFATETKTTTAIETNEAGEYHPLIFFDKHNKRGRANVLRVIDASSFVIDTLLDEITLLDDNKILLYGQLPNDFHRLNKDAVFTLATSALQEVDRQLQAEKAKVVTLETQLASVLARLDALESV